MGAGSLRGKRVLITGGPTWVAIDDVRVISNISTGEMSLLLARRAASLGMKVDLLLGPAMSTVVLPARVRVSRFKFYHELAALLTRKLRVCRYDVILHAAAVSDYLCRSKQGKMSSASLIRTLHLTRAPKLIRKIKRLNPDALLVIFKLETGLTDTALVRRGLLALKDTGSDFVVANTIHQGLYRGLILDEAGRVLCAASKNAVSVQLLTKIKESLS